jgi:hypothetical protein
MAPCANDSDVASEERPPVPETTKQVVLAEAGYKCGNPTCRVYLTLELHHIVWVKDGGSNAASNLLPLCPNCHSLHTYGKIKAHAIRMWKSALQTLNNPNRASADVLLVLYDEMRATKENNDHVPFAYTGDSLGTLAGLLTAGLVEITMRSLNYGHFGGGTPYFQVALTEKGIGFVETWRRGDKGPPSEDGGTGDGP